MKPHREIHSSRLHVFLSALPAIDPKSARAENAFGIVGATKSLGLTAERDDESRCGRRRSIVMGMLSALILLVALPGRPSSAAEGERKYKPTMSSPQLEEKAKWLQALVEEKIVRNHGLIPMFVRASDYQLPTAEDYKGAYRHRHILEKPDEDTFRFVRPGTKPAWAGAGDTIEQFEIESKLIDGDSLTAWLAASWEGRWRGSW